MNPENTASAPDADEIIHYWPDQAEPSACDINIMVTPYTYGSPVPSEVTCPECLKFTSPPKVYRYAIKYFIVDEFGELLWRGQITLAQDTPRPTDAVKAAIFDQVNTVKTIRANCDSIAAPAGRILIAAVFAI